MTMRAGFRLRHLVLLLALAPTSVTALMPRPLQEAASTPLQEAASTARGDSNIPSTVNNRTTTYFLGIGINEYEDVTWQDLEGAVPDVDGLAAILGEHYEIVIDDRYLLRDGAASRDSINKVLKEFRDHLEELAAAGDTANAIFYFAGHGYFADDDNPLNEGSVFLIPADGEGSHEADLEAIIREPRGLDATELKWIWLEGILREFSMKRSLKQVIVIVDACDAGSESVALFPQSKQNEDRVQNEGREVEARELMTAAGAERPAIERDREGVFTGRLIEALDALANRESGDGMVYSNQVWVETITLLESFKKESFGMVNVGDPLLGTFAPEHPQRSRFIFRVKSDEERKAVAESVGDARDLAKRFDEIWSAWSRRNPVSEWCSNVGSELGANRADELEGADSLGDAEKEATIRRWGIAFMCRDAMALELPSLLPCDVAKPDREAEVKIMGWNKVEKRYDGAYCKKGKEVQR